MPPIPNLQDLAKQLPAIAAALATIIGLITGLATQAPQLSSGSDKPGVVNTGTVTGKPVPGRTASWFDFSGCCGGEGTRGTGKLNGKIYANSIAVHGRGERDKVDTNQQYKTLTATVGMADATKSKYPNATFSVIVTADGKTVFKDDAVVGQLLNVKADVNYAKKVEIQIDLLSKTGDQLFIDKNTLFVGTPTFHS
ncbi:NPCBM/NEW2 domain-containing protein [Corynebacterium epidermidicanis]|uniref:Putative carbohydrate binding protein n=1 Tax=Corynebacterium epidermidicanis TaxID=1050174 RepID=A0A0G3GTY4_9CORY|nr:NPCBM/NEW2 domain-containing protein [Corynebacterium epidermidicanis]AKK02302.1 putative carbohydrate binding protein [Corynebacterium epidermidicanis]